MYLYQYALMAAICCLFLSKETRLASSAFIVGWVVYLLITNYLQADKYYICSATIETAIAFTLNKRYRLVSYFGYSLIFVNAFGFYLFTNNMQPDTYDVIYAIISTIQVLLLILRAAHNGAYRLPIEHSFVRIIDFDSRAKGNILRQNTKEKKSYK